VTDALRRNVGGRLCLFSASRHGQVRTQSIPALSPTTPATSDDGLSTPYVYPDQSDELPAYSNSIHLVTLCRRKLEYTAPNVRARKGTRAWDFYWLVLSGTALNVYKPTRSELKVHIKCEASTRAARLKEHKRATAAQKRATPLRPLLDVRLHSL